ncbi:type IV pilus modification PilV family protein [Lacipirellula parvula]|uniref:Uncharacterized protein n=1 Tax=Lacipirellula parvula TaxID=2650471 RepID=A0A5K7XGU9_9BACT|nr:hypothetical protein [Lacipirellula parvula]BBO32189.1 hypothetical protein PLANPX_1801 [Lacipirellula parvula]
MTNQLHIRRGISLLEVLISMFVLLFGLMGVAAVFPVGNHYAGKGEQFDRGSALAEAAMADLKARGYLKPENWLYAAQPTNGVVAGDYRVIQPDWIPGGSPTLNPTADYFNTTGTVGGGQAFVIDPLGEAAARNDGMIADRDIFPFAFFSDAYPTGADNDPLFSTNSQNVTWPATPLPPSTVGLAETRWPIRRLTLSSTNVPTTTVAVPNMSVAFAETIFRLHDDVTNELPKQDDRPAIQRWSAVDSNATPTPNYAADDTLLSRQYSGSYSWIATIVPTTTGGLNALQPINPQFGSELYEVSVAVLNKRELTPSAASERSIAAVMNLGNELVISAANNNTDAVDNAVDGIRAGNWIAVAGVHQGTGQFLMRWYRILSIDDESQDRMLADGSNTGNFAIRRLMLDGPEWPLNSGSNLRAILLPGVISVATQMLPMEAQ